MGVHISKVRSLTLDTWTMEQAKFMEKWGNKRVNAVYEAMLPASKKPNKDTPEYQKKQFIFSKYQNKIWYKEGVIKKKKKVEKTKKKTSDSEDDSSEASGSSSDDSAKKSAAKKKSKAKESKEVKKVAKSSESDSDTEKAKRRKSKVKKGSTRPPSVQSSSKFLTAKPVFDADFSSADFEASFDNMNFNSPQASQPPPQFDQFGQTYQQQQQPQPLQRRTSFDSIMSLFSGQMPMSPTKHMGQMGQMGQMGHMPMSPRSSGQMEQMGGLTHTGYMGYMGHMPMSPRGSGQMEQMGALTPMGQIGPMGQMGQVDPSGRGNNPFDFHPVPVAAADDNPFATLDPFGSVPGNPRSQGIAVNMIRAGSQTGLQIGSQADPFTGLGYRT